MLPLSIMSLIDLSRSKLKAKVYAILAVLEVQTLAVGLATLVVIKVMTPQITVGGGYGWDGLTYGQMALDFNGTIGQISAQPPFNYRFLPSLIVHFAVSNSALDPFLAFLILNAASFLLASVLLAKLLRLYFASASRQVIVACVLWFMLILPGLRVWIGAPVSTDALGTLLMVAALYFTVANRQLAYVMAMTLGMATRENLVILIVFNVLYGFFKSRESLLKFVLWQAPIIAAFGLFRLYPIFPPSENYSFLTTAGEFATRRLDPINIVRLIVSSVNGLGVLLLLPVFNYKQSWNFLKDNVEWLAYILMTVLLALVGGADTDRFFSWLFPIGLVLTCLWLNGEHFDLASLVAITFVQLIIMGSLALVQQDEGFVLRTYAAHASIRDLISMGIRDLVAGLALYVYLLSHSSTASAQRSRAV